MKKRWFLFSFCLLILFLFASIVPVYAESAANVTIRGVAVKFTEETGYPFVDNNSRTQVPLRITMETYGCDVDWDSDNKTAIVEKGGTKVLAPIGKSYIIVNGKTVQNDTTALIKNGRTYLPIRAVLEAFGAKVSWDAATKTVEVDKPVVLNGITSISVSSSDAGYSVIVDAQNAIENYSSFSLDDPDRMVIDIADSKLLQSGNSVSGNNTAFSSVRYSQFTTEKVRVVIDLEGTSKGDIAVSPDGKKLTIAFAGAKAANSSSVSRGSTATRTGTGTSSNSSKPATQKGTPVSGVPTLDESMWDKLIVIDPGHGGEDSGSVGVNPDGTDVYEKDINLKVATRLTAILKAAGASVQMTRTGDTTVQLHDRTTLANNLGAYLIVSCHNNSSVSPVANGTETHYNSTKDESAYGIDSATLAQNVQSELVKYIGLNNRKTFDSPQLSIVKRSIMPAIIIEGAFISNASDLAYMQTDAFVEAYAKGAAIGIINTLNDAVK